MTSRASSKALFAHSFSWPELAGALVVLLILAQAGPGWAQAVNADRATGETRDLSTQRAQSAAVSQPATDVIPGRLFLRTSFEFSSGDYGDVRDTSILYAPITARWDIGAWRLSLNLPFLQVDGPSDLITAGDGDPPPPPPPPPPGGGPVGAPPPPPPPPPVESESHGGLGDIVIGASYALPPIADDRVFFELQTNLTSPTADQDRGLGTGKTDISFGTEVAVRAGNFWPYASAAYRIVGRTKNYDLQNGALASAGLQWQDEGPIGVGVELDYRRALSRSAHDPLEAVAYASYALGKDWLLGLHSTAGFSRASPDYAVGTSIGFYFN